jgi:membrane associated rhomboid family serine protease
MRKPPEGSTEPLSVTSAQPVPPAEQQETPEAPEYPETLCISEGTFRQIRDDSLVLLSQGIEHRLTRLETGPFQIHILPEQGDFAKEQLKLYHLENPPKEENPPLPLSFSLQPLWVLLAPVFVTLLDFSEKVNLHTPGLSDASKVLKGEWWRSLTAQTLHGDARHLASNLLCGYIVMNMITFRIPLLRLAPFIAIAAAIANICVAATVQTDFRSLGFSTFVFAAIGCLAVIEFRLMPKESHGMLRRFAPLCGAASLAVFLGLGENADILGHAYGFIAGLFCGFIPNKKSLRWGSPLSSADGIGLLFYYGLYLMAWKMAI